LSLSGSGFIDGDIVLGDGASCNRQTSPPFACANFLTAGNSVVTSPASDAELNAAITACQNVSTTLTIHDPVTNPSGTLTCDMQIPTLQGSQIITAHKNPTVVCVEDVNIEGKDLVVLTGGPNTSFVFVVTGNFSIHGGSKNKAKPGSQFTTGKILTD